MRMEDVLLIHLIFVQLSTQIQTHSTFLWKLKPESANFRDNLELIFENFTRAQKYFTQVPLVPLVTNSMSGHFWRHLGCLWRWNWPPPQNHDQGDINCGDSSQADSILNFFPLKFPLKFYIASQPGWQAGTINVTLPITNIYVNIHWFWGELTVKKKV